MSHQRNELMSRVLRANLFGLRPGFKRWSPPVILLSAAPLVYILKLLQMKEEPAPPSSWFRHVGKLAFLAAGPKHQNNGSGCVITLHTQKAALTL